MILIVRRLLAWGVALSLLLPLVLILVLSLPFLLFTFTTTLLNHIALESTSTEG